jgi:hypothetical protein
MKRFIYLTLLILVINLIGCGGGHDPVLPGGQRDLSGLEGSWLGELGSYGDLSGSEGAIPISRGRTLDCIITRNSIDMDELVSWSYDGSVLVLHLNSIDTVWYSDCGKIDMTVETQLSIILKPGATYGEIAGIEFRDGTSELCGTVTGMIKSGGRFMRQ